MKQIVQGCTDRGVKPRLCASKITLSLCPFLESHNQISGARDRKPSPLSCLESGIQREASLHFCSSQQLPGEGLAQGKELTSDLICVCTWRPLCARFPAGMQREETGSVLVPKTVSARTHGFCCRTAH